LPPATICGPKIPAMKALVWLSPMRMTLASEGVPALPMWMLLLPVNTVAPAVNPMAMLLLPVVLKARAPAPGQCCCCPWC
jgi:hypothetical protein